ncbi:MAG: response regulator, partial [Armatimonadetes bacterium]|nr:response regulator [Armatimonadota bacterium]
METDIPLCILFVEDVPADAELAERMLRQDGLVFTSTLVDTEEAFLRALEEFRPDLIISDYSMPSFDGMSALKLTLEHDAALPFLLLTGAINEETAVTCMKAGATDYVVKEHIKRLPFAVKEALERKKARLAQAEAEKHILRAKEEWERTFDTMPDLIYVLDAKHTILRVNRAMADKLGISPDEAVGKVCYECVHGLQGPPDFCPHAQLLKDKQEHTAEFHESRLGGDFLLTCTPWRDQDGQVLGSVHVAHDITERKQ